MAGSINNLNDHLSNMSLFLHFHVFSSNLGYQMLFPGYLHSLLNVLSLVLSLSDFFSPYCGQQSNHVTPAQNPWIAHHCPQQEIQTPLYDLQALSGRGPHPFTISLATFPSGAPAFPRLELTTSFLIPETICNIMFVWLTPILEFT